MSDLSIMIDNIKLNIRVGMIFKYNERVLLEVPKMSVTNSVIPGGRVKINESSIDALCRELKEEMGFIVDKNKITFKTTLENFFSCDEIRFHEIFFVYEYLVDKDDYEKLLNIKENQDSHKTYFAFVKYDELIKYNLLPLNVIPLIKE